MVRFAMLFAVLFCLLFVSPASAQCRGGVCSLPGQPVARAVRLVAAPVRFVRQNKPVRSAIARVQPVRRVARGVGWLFGR